MVGVLSGTHLCLLLDGGKCNIKRVAGAIYCSVTLGCGKLEKWQRGDEGAEGPTTVVLGVGYTASPGVACDTASAQQRPGPMTSDCRVEPQPMHGSHG